MKRVKMVVAYDGTNYHGWQIQPNAVTIEEKLNIALSTLLQEEIQVIGASRTDAGVHARGNVCVFDTNTRMEPTKICYALNQRLPEDIVIQSTEEVEPSFHPRFSKSRKTYEYRILNRSMRLPEHRYNTYFYHHSLDVTAMQQAASYFVGEHDFKSFCCVRTQSETTVRTVYSCNVTKSQDMITIRIQGNGFLYNMVRIIAGTLITVGAGKLRAEQIEEILKKEDRQCAGPTAPACGLTLIGLDYEDEQ